MDVFCDLIWGSGWGEGLAGLSGLRDEGVTTKDGLKVPLEDRECNWAMVSFEHSGIYGMADERTSLNRLNSSPFLPLDLIHLGQRTTRNLLKTTHEQRIPSSFSKNSFRLNIVNNLLPLSLAIESVSHHSFRLRRTSGNKPLL